MAKDLRDHEDQTTSAHESDVPMGELYGFCVELGLAADLRAIARLVARVAYRSLSGRGVHVQLWDDDAPCGVVEAARGPEMSIRMHREPLTSSAGKVGEIVVDLDGRELEEREQRVLTLIAVPAATRARAELRRRERAEAQRATVLAMARLAERPENQTGAHLRRVSLYCRHVAEGLRDMGCYVEELTDGFIEDLVHSAPLHDVGKVGLPDSLLLKTGKLDEREWELMKTHVELGVQVLDEIVSSLKDPGFLTMGRDIARCHHEKWDGTGYPAGLAGLEIPLAARIFALADTYDALTSARPYKSAWSHEESIEHIRGLAGTHLDARVVEAFLGSLADVDSVRARFADEPDDVEAPYEQILETR